MKDATSLRNGALHSVTLSQITSESTALKIDKAFKCMDKLFSDLMSGHCALTRNNIYGRWDNKFYRIKIGYIYNEWCVTAKLELISYCGHGIDKIETISECEFEDVSIGIIQTERI